MKVLIVYSDINCSCTKKNTFELSKGLKSFVKKVETLFYNNLSENHFNEYDIIIFQRIGANGVQISEEYLNRVTRLIEKYRKKVITIYNIDDLILNYVSKYFISIVNLVLVPNTGYDKYIYPLNENISYTRTFIDKEFFDNVKSNLNLPKNKLKFLWSSTGLLGFDFMQKLIPEISKKFPDSVFYIIGGGSSFYFENFSNTFCVPLVDYEKFIKYFKECDIYLNPVSSGMKKEIKLIDNTNDFINCKSEIKYLHCGLAKIPIISSKSLPYEFAIKNNLNGIIIENNVDEWINAINKLICDNNFKNFITENAYLDVTSNYLLENLGKKMYKLFRNAFDLYSRNSFELPHADINQIDGTAVVGDIFGNKTIYQNFVSNFNNLSIIELKIGTYMRINTGKLKIEIIENNNNEKIIRESEVPCDKFTDNSWFNFKFEPIKGSKNKKYTLKVYSVGCKIGSAVTVYYDPLFSNIGDFSVNKTIFKGTLSFKTYYYK